MRVRSESFNDHFSQALQFFNSQTEVEQSHIISAFIFELSKVQTEHVRLHMLGQLANVSVDIAKRVANGLGVTDPIPAVATVKSARTDLKPSDALSIVKKAVPGIRTKQIGLLVADGTNGKIVDALKAEAAKGGAEVKVVAPKVGGTRGANGELIRADFQLAGGPSVLFDAVYVAVSEAGAKSLSTEAAAVGWVHDAFSHLKVIGATGGGKALLDKAGVSADAGIAIDVDAATYLKAVASGRIYDREAKVRTQY